LRYARTTFTPFPVACDPCAQLCIEDIEAAALEGAQDSAQASGNSPLNATFGTSN